MARGTLDSVTIPEIFDECTTDPNDLHRPWQLRVGKTPTDKSVCENPDVAQCSVEVVDEAATHRLCVEEESYKAYIEEELSLRKRRKEIHQARLLEALAAGKCCRYWRSGKHKGSRMLDGVFFGPARVLLQERETTAEGVRMKGGVWITEGVFCSMCCTAPAFSESEQILCSIADTEAISFQDLVGRLPHSTFLDLTTQTDVGRGNHWLGRSTRDPSSGSSFWPQQPGATSHLGPHLVPPSRLVRGDDEMVEQEQETTHVPFTHFSASESIPPDVPVVSVPPEDPAQTLSTRRITFKRHPNPLDVRNLRNVTRDDVDEDSALLSLLCIMIWRACQNI